ncbi:MBL fold metallo-hydrolase [Maribacter sp. HTCC2170]|uniref:MBL fold metallo-hydrolase n=1 Tax=Maribacter sp. (strain HTCC2170 / KCCM 42371) TaxID=313603 RepID=UPI0002E3EF2D|nr:MBL fold metallo-hydrolase [Maribacter sp. HTCC2170]
MKKMKHLSVMVICMGFITLANAQEKEVVIKIDTLSQDVYMLTGQGGNIGIYVGESNVFMIDDQFARLSNKIKSAIATLTDQPISFLFNTHMHGDHTGGNAEFNSKQTTVVAHDNVRKSLEDRLAKNQKLNKKILPEVSFSDDITFYDGDETIMAFHVHDAHTDGDAMVYFLKNNVLHMGDTYFSGRYPYIDLKSGGTVDGYIKAHKKALLLINEETKIIPGHGKSSNKKELESYVIILEDIKLKILKEIQRGRTLEEVKKNTNLLSAYDATHGGGYIGPERIREIFYNSLKND